MILPYCILLSLSELTLCLQDLFLLILEYFLQHLNLRLRLLQKLPCQVKLVKLDLLLGHQLPQLYLPTSAFSLKWPITISWDVQRSIRPFIMTTSNKNKKQRLERDSNRMKQKKEKKKKKKRDGWAYLCQNKYARLPHNPSSMITQALIVIVFDDGRQLLECKP